MTLHEWIETLLARQTGVPRERVRVVAVQGNLFRVQLDYERITVVLG